MVQVKNLSHRFGPVDLFHEFDCDFPTSSFTTIKGKSGSGKSTLLSFIGLLDKPTFGRIIYEPHGEIVAYTAKARYMRREFIGYIHQNYALIDQETVFQNLALVLSGNTTRKRIQVAEALSRVGLDGFENKPIYQCSGGEQQRIAIARLIVKPCQVIIADEPTGNLDEENKTIIMNLLQSFHDQGKTLIIASHDSDVLAMGERTIHLAVRGNLSNKEG